MSPNIPASWIDARLEDVAEVHDHLREPVNSTERATRHGPYPYYGATGQVGWIDGFRQEGNFVLLGEDGAPFLDPSKPKAYLVTGKCWVNNHAHVLKGTDGLCLNQYLMHALNAADYRGYANGTTRLKLTQGAMRRLAIKLAPLGEQRRIVEKIEELLSDLDAGVAALERARINLKRYRAAVLKAAVEGKVTEQWRKEHPNLEPASKLLERILVERRRKWEEAQLAKYAAAGKTPPQGWKAKYPEPEKPDAANLPVLPGGWCWAIVDQVSVFVRNGLPDKASAEPPGFPILRINSVRPMSVDILEVRYLNRAYEEISEYFINNGDLLFTRYNGSIDLLGVSGVVRNCDRQIAHPDKLIRVKTTFADTLPYFVELASNVGISREHIQARARTTAGQTGVSGTDIKEMPLPLCSLEEQRLIVDEVHARLSAITQVLSEIQGGIARAARLRQSILKRAFEGKLIPQDPNDEPASVLLERIRAARADWASSAKSAGGRRRAVRPAV